jgi:hypothetical protein
MASVINQIKLGSTEYAIAHSAYAECATAAGTAAKAATISTDSDTTNTAFTLIKGVAVNVKFTVTNTAANPTLNINSSGAKAIYYNGAAITAGYLKANKVYQFVYNGTQWDLVGDVDTNTTYTIPTALKNPNALTIQGNGTTLTNGTYDGSAAKTVNITPSAIGAATAAQGTKADNALPKSGGNISGHIYLTGANASSSTGSTSQIVFGTSDNNHVVISSNDNTLVINPSTSTTTNQIVLYLDKPSQFPSGITGNLTGTASNASKVTNAITFNNSGAGAASGTTFNGSAARTISYNTIGAAPAYQYSTTDLTANSSSLTTGTLYFAYE